VEKSKDSRQQWVFREPGEKWLNDCVHPKEQNKEISLMVRGCFWGKKKGRLVPITQGNITKTRYTRLLRKHLIPVIHQMLACGIHDFLFRQDKAPVHTSYSVMD